MKQSIIILATCLETNNEVRYVADQCVGDELEALKYDACHYAAIDLDTAPENISIETNTIYRID